MESPLSPFRMHWDPEPLAVPRRTESADKSDALQTLRARGGVSGRRGSVWSACVFSAAFPRQAAIRWPGRFMESLLSLFRMHWDHEPVWAIQSAAGPAHSKTWRKCARLWPTFQRLGVRRSSAAFDGSAYSEFVRFMERSPQPESTSSLEPK